MVEITARGRHFFFMHIHHITDSAEGVERKSDRSDNVERLEIVVCVPVYGQSLAMGEESELVTDIDGLTNKWNGRLVGEGLDDEFGYCVLSAEQ